MTSIIFDLDNTLLDFMRYKHICISSAVDAMIKSGLNIKKKEALKQINNIYKKHTMEDHHVFERFLKKNLGKIDYHKLAVAITAYRKARPKTLTPYPNTISTLKKLKSKNIKLAVVSDAPELKLWLRLVAAKLDTYFDVVISTEHSRQKPSKIPFRQALKQLGSKPEDCLFVGDNPRRDIKGAKSIKMKTCLAKYGLIKPSKIKADYEINKIQELLKII